MSLCRICGSSKANQIGTFRPYLDFQGFDVYDCRHCDCRFVWRKMDIHENMHVGQNSPYANHEKIANEVNKFFQKNRLDSIKKYLSKTIKFKFIIDNITPANKNAEILELGCSIGYLTSYFILAGYNAIGADISTTAVQKARSYFGKHFVPIDKHFYSHEGHYDFIYHTGTIGCVNDPIAFTKALLNLLKPGGKLLFNAPDAESTKEMGALWHNFAPPPDLITMFNKNFWEKHFAELADIDIIFEPYSHYNNAGKHIKKLLNRPYLALKPKSFYKSDYIKVKNKYSYCIKILNLYKFFVIHIFYYLSKLHLVHHYKNEFGMFVTLTKK